MAPRLDLVVYGASGFTGSLVVSYLRRHAPPGLRWALAGRDAAKLEGAAAAPLVDPPASECAPAEILGGCDASSAAEVITSARPRVVLSTAGPFVDFSDALVGACARAGIGYCDINGEIPWVQRVLQRDDEAARASEALIVPNCGFDAVPSDLSALMATQQLQLRGGAAPSPCVGVRTYIHMLGVVSGGTIETGLVMEDRFPGEKRQPFLLGGGDALARGIDSAVDADPTEARYDARIRRWVAPFGMAQINTRVVRRSAGVLGAYANVDVTRFRYEEVALAPGGQAAAAKMALNAAIPPEKLRALRERGRLFKPGSGPSAEKRAASTFRTVAIAEAADGTCAASAVSGGDPGYDETAKMVSEAALALLVEDRASLPFGGRGGVLTPAAALGDVLIRRLRGAGMRFDEEFDPAALAGEPDEEAEAGLRA